MNNEICNLCGNFITKNSKQDEFLKSDDFLNLISYKEVNKLNTKCVVCKSEEFERLIIGYLEKNEIFKDIKNLRILHFNPEPLLISYLAQKNPEIHILATKTLQDLRFEGIDIESIPYDDESFDLVIANNLIQKTEKFEKALFEINRVLHKNGIAIIQTPFSELLENTFEDSAVEEPELRKKIYGDVDNKRIFGKNIKKQFLDFFDSYDINLSNYEDYFRSESNIKIDLNLFIFKKKNINIETNKNRIKLNETNIKPLLSILCLTYNHEKYIQKAIEGFLGQKTNFSYEIIIAEDCSTDKTKEIIEDYQKQYENRIKLISYPKNIGMHKNFINALNECKGEYIAYCEGDDYWTDSNKIQKQVDFLERNSNYVLTYAGVQAIRDNKIDYNYTGGLKWDLTADQLKSVQSINTLTTVFRNIVNDIPPEIESSGVIDSFIWSLLGNYGAGHYCHNVLPSIYRMHDSGIHSSKSDVERKKTRIKTFYSLYTYYSRMQDYNYSNYFLNQTKKDIQYLFEVLDHNLAHNLVKLIPDEMASKAKNLHPFDAELLKSMTLNTN